MKLKIKKGDVVEVIAGNDRGTQGRVLDVNAEKMRILVEGVNIRKKHSKPTQQNQTGGIVSKEMPIHYSNVQIIDSDKKPTRIAIDRKIVEGKPVSTRIAKSNGKVL